MDNTDVNISDSRSDEIETRKKRDSQNESARASERESREQERRKEGESAQEREGEQGGEGGREGWLMREGEMEGEGGREGEGEEDEERGSESWLNFEIACRSDCWWVMHMYQTDVLIPKVVLERIMFLIVEEAGNEIELESETGVTGYVMCLNFLMALFEAGRGSKSGGVRACNIQNILDAGLPRALRRMLASAFECAKLDYRNCLDISMNCLAAVLPAMLVLVSVRSEVCRDITDEISCEIFDMLLDPFFSTMAAGMGQECALVFLSVNFLDVTLPHNFLGTSDSDVLVASIVSVAAATTGVVLCDEVWVLLRNRLDVSDGLASDAKECDFPQSIKRALVSIEPYGGLNSLEIVRDLKTWQTFCSESVDVLSISVTAVPKLRARL